MYSETYDECDADGEDIPGNGEGIANQQAGRNVGSGNVCWEFFGEEH